MGHPGRGPDGQCAAVDICVAGISADQESTNPSGLTRPAEGIHAYQDVPRGDASGRWQPPAHSVETRAQLQKDDEQDADTLSPPYSTLISSADTVIEGGTWSVRQL